MPRSHSFSAHSSNVSFTSSAFFANAPSYFLHRSWYSPLMKHILHSSLFSLSIFICEQKLRYWAAKCKLQPFDNAIHNHLRYTMLYIRSRWIPTIFVVKTTLVHQLPTLHAMCAFTLYRYGVFSYLQCSWIVQEHFEPSMAFITCSNNIWQPFFAVLKNCFAWTIVVSATNPSISQLSLFTCFQAYYNVKKVTQNTPLWTFHFSHFVSISCYFAIIYSQCKTSLEVFTFFPKSSWIKFILQISTKYFTKSV